MKKRNQDLEALADNQKELINMSRVETVQKALNDAEAAQEYADDCIRKVEQEKEKAINAANKKVSAFKVKADASLHRQYISYGIMGVFLLILSIIHHGFWTDLFYFFKTPTDWASDAINNLISSASEGYTAWKWIGAILIGLLFLGTLALLGLLIATLRKRWNMLTITTLLICVGVTVLVGDYLPFNRIILFTALTIVYTVLCPLLDKKFSSYPNNLEWEEFQKELRIKSVK